MRLSLFATAALCAFTLSAHADTVTSYQLNAITSDGGVLSGTFNIDQTNLFSSTANLTYVTGLTSTPVLYNLGHGTSNGYPQLDFSSTPQDAIGRTEADLIFSGTFADPISVCTTSANNCPNGEPAYVFESLGTSSQAPEFVTAATLTPLTATPEPSTFALLGTGILGAVGVIRKRLA